MRVFKNITVSKIGFLGMITSFYVYKIVKSAESASV
jgi:hypothetical protein